MFFFGLGFPLPLSWPAAGWSQVKVEEKMQKGEDNEPRTSAFWGFFVQPKMFVKKKAPAFFRGKNKTILGVGWKNRFSCLPLPGKVIQFDQNTFSNGWFSHQRESSLDHPKRCSGIPSIPLRFSRKPGNWNLILMLDSWKGAWGILRVSQRFGDVWSGFATCVSPFSSEGIKYWYHQPFSVWWYKGTKSGQRLLVYPETNMR